VNLNIWKLFGQPRSEIGYGLKRHMMSSGRDAEHFSQYPASVGTYVNAVSVSRKLGHKRSHLSIVAKVSATDRVDQLCNYAGLILEPKPPDSAPRDTLEHGRRLHQVECTHDGRRGNPTHISDL
jgi:hypothetical protein